MKPRKGTSTDHIGSDGVGLLLTPTSAVDPEKQHGNKRCDEEEDDDEEKQFGSFCTAIKLL